MKYKIRLIQAAIMAAITLTCINGHAASWSYATPGGMAVQGSPAIGPDGTIYITSTDGYLYSLNPTTANANWYTNLGNNSGLPVSSPTIGSDGTIYVASTGNGTPELYAVNPSSGSATALYTLGINEADDEVPEGNSLGTPAIGSDGTIYTTADDNSDVLFAVEPNGTAKWGPIVNGNPESSDGQSPVAIGPNGTIYYYSEAGQLDAFSNSNGGLKWQWDAPGGANDNFLPSLAIGADGTVYVSSIFTDYSQGIPGFNPGYGVVYAVATNGIMKWAWTSPDGDTLTAPVLGPDGTIYVGSTDGYLYALDECGDQQWAKQTPGGNAIFATPVVATNSVGNTILYVGDQGNNLNMTDSSAGSSLSTIFTAGGAINSSPVIGSDGTVYFGADDGSVYAVSETAHLASSPWPMVCRNVQHTSLQPSYQSPPSCPSAVDNTFRTATDGEVRDVAVQRNNSVLIVGAFANVNNQAATMAARLNPDGTQDFLFNANSAMENNILDANCVGVDSIHRVYVGGDNGNCGVLMRLDYDGNVDINPENWPGPYVVLFTETNAYESIYTISGSGRETYIPQELSFLSNGIRYTYNLGWATNIFDIGGTIYGVDASGDEIALPARLWMETDLTIGGSFSMFDGAVDTNACDVMIGTTPGNDIYTDGQNLYPGIANGEVNCLAGMNGDLIVGGWGLSSIYGDNNIVNGSYGLQDHMTFGGGADSAVLAIGMQTNGKAVVGGDFSTLGADASGSHNFIGRFNSNGTVDETFNPNPSIITGDVNTILIEPNGKILVGWGGGLTRFNADGTLDTSFNIPVNGWVDKLVLDNTETYVLVVGSFSTVGGQTHQNIARIFLNNE